MKIQSHKLNFSSFKNVKEVEKSAVIIEVGFCKFNHLASSIRK